MKDYRDTVIQNIKDCGQSLIENAEKIVNTYDFISDISIYLNVTDRESPPTISINTDVIPESLVNRAYKR